MPALESNFYIANQKRIMRELKIAIPHFKQATIAVYGSEFAESVITETFRNFAVLLPDIPYIGGWSNRLTENLYLSAAMLAFYQALKTRGKTIEETARLIYQGADTMYSSLPFSPMLRFMGWTWFGPRHSQQLKKAASISQEHRYAGDWVFDFVEGDGKTHEFGVDYTECGIVNYLTEQGAAELIPYLCWLDYPMCKAMQVGLVRTETLGQGGTKCNFRFCRQKELSEIVPDFMKN